MNSTQTQVNDLIPFDFEKQSLDQPESWMSWYVPGAVICQTSLDNHFFPLEAQDKERFRYGEAVEFEFLEECDHMPGQYHAMVRQLSEVSSALAPMELVAVSVEDDYFTLYYTELDTYFVLSEQHLQNISPHTISGLASLKPTGFADARYLQLNKDGRIVL